MTLDELKQKLAIDKIVETGIGLVSYKTYNEIAELLIPEQSKREAKPWPEISFNGIVLIQNCFVPDGEVYPFPKWDLRPKKVPFPVKRL